MIIEQIGKPILYAIWASSSAPLNRYALHPGRIFGNPRSDNRFRILDNYGNYVIYKDIKLEKVLKRDFEELLEDWTERGIREITDFEHLIESIKTMLNPFLGTFLVTLLVKWLSEKLK